MFHQSDQHSGDGNEAWLYLNGLRLEESYHFTDYTGPGGYVESLGSRTDHSVSFIIIKLEHQKSETS